MAFKADDRSYFAILKKEIHALAVAANLSQRRVGELDIIVAEMVSNLVKHAGGGQVWVQLIEEQGLQGLELISIDSGPGMGDVNLMIADGFSSKNTLGHGLGAMKRLSDLFQVYSQKDWGTLVLVRVFESPLPLPSKIAKEEIRSIVLPKPGEKECGDGFYQLVTKTHIKLFLGDGLGHGPEAAKAVTEAGNVFMQCEATDPVDILRQINGEVKRTRGLVGTTAIFDRQKRCWKICGVGNIMTRMIGSASSKTIIPYNGIIGLNVPRNLNVQEMDYEKGQCLVLCSDGLKSKWDVGRHHAIGRFDASILAACLIKDFARNSDDMSVAVCKLNM